MPTLRNQYLRVFKRLDTLLCIIGAFYELSQVDVSPENDGTSEQE